MSTITSGEADRGSRFESSRCAGHSFTFVSAALRSKEIAHREYPCVKTTVPSLTKLCPSRAISSLLVSDISANFSPLQRCHPPEDKTVRETQFRGASTHATNMPLSRIRIASGGRVLLRNLNRRYSQRFTFQPSNLSFDVSKSERPFPYRSSNVCRWYFTGVLMGPIERVISDDKRQYLSRAVEYSTWRENAPWNTDHSRE